MKVRPLLITDAVRAEVARVMVHAERERFTLDELLQRCRGETFRDGQYNPSQDIPAIGDDPGHCCEIPFGYRVVFSIEEQMPPLGWCRHISISVDEDGMLPSEVAAMEIARLFGFTDDPKKCYLEGERAVNFVQPMEPLPPTPPARP